MRFIRASLLLGLTLSYPALATDEDGIRTGRRGVQSAAEATLSNGVEQLHARGPGTLFTSVEDAAVDALIYAYLQAHGANDTSRIRGGTIFPVGGYYSYGEIRTAKPGTPHRISYRFGPHEVARFHAYPVYRDILTNRGNERISRVDRRYVSVVDPLHRPLYILHPSLAIRAYSGAAAERAEVANLRQREPTPLFAGN